MFSVLSSSVPSHQYQKRSVRRFAPTNGYHALAIIVQVLHQHLTKTVDFALAILREISRQKPTLLLQGMHQIGQFLYHALVRAEILLLGQHYTKVEDELISVVAGGFHADRISENAVAIHAHMEQVTTELLARDHEE